MPKVDGLVASRQNGHNNPIVWGAILCAAMIEKGYEVRLELSGPMGNGKACESVSRGRR